MHEGSSGNNRPDAWMEAGVGVGVAVWPSISRAVVPDRGGLCNGNEETKVRSATLENYHTELQCNQSTAVVQHPQGQTWGLPEGSEKES